MIKCNLTNDKSGSDLTEFWNALNKSSGSYQVRSVIKNTTDSILFFVKRSTINYKGKDIVNSEFTLNNIAIAANDREVLPLFTYLAKLTRTLAAKPEISVEKTQLLKTANKSIEEEAMRYIDNMY